MERNTDMKRCFRQNIQKRREGAGITREELATSCGLDERTIYNYESGNRFPRADTAVLLARTLGCTVEELFQEED